jgi:hypothetical protein
MVGCVWGFENTKNENLSRRAREKFRYGVGFGSLSSFRIELEWKLLEKRVPFFFQSEAQPYSDGMQNFLWKNFIAISNEEPEGKRDDPGIAPQFVLFDIGSLLSSELI